MLNGNAVSSLVSVASRGRNGLYPRAVEDNPDDFGVLFLVDVVGDVYATDRGWESTGSLRSGEGVLRYTGQLRAGDVLRLSDFQSHSGGS